MKTFDILVIKVLNKIKSKTGYPVHNYFNTSFKKNCLILYIQDPFINNNENNYYHQNQIQVMEIARIIKEFGYNVDIVDYRSKKVLLRKKYDAIFDVCVKKNPVYSNNLAKGVKKIVYFTGSESEFANSAELARIKGVEERKGIKLRPRRQAPLISKDVEKFDEAILIGNKFNLQTYSEFCFKKIFLVHNTGYDFGNRFDFENRNPTSFLYFGSAGSVHKGLDLLLDVFSEKNFPCSLYVCGNFAQEEDFESAYYNELYNTKNIIPIGNVNIFSDKFVELCNECCFTILPSCSETMAGAIATCMSAGLIPICSEICGYSENPEVITLENCSITTIRKTVLEMSRKDKQWIIKRSYEILDLVNNKYNMKCFRTEMKNALENVLKE